MILVALAVVGAIVFAALLAAALTFPVRWHAPAPGSVGLEMGDEEGNADRWIARHYSVPPKGSQAWREFVARAQRDLAGVLETLDGDTAQITLTAQVFIVFPRRQLEEAITR